MNRDVAKLESIARDLGEFGSTLSGRTEPLDAAVGVSIGQAFVALSEVVTSIAAALEQGAQSARDDLIGAEPEGASRFPV